MGHTSAFFGDYWFFNWTSFQRSYDQRVVSCLLYTYQQQLVLSISIPFTNCWINFLLLCWHFSISQCLLRSKHWTCSVTKCTLPTAKYNEFDYLARLLSQLECFLIEYINRYIIIVFLITVKLILISMLFFGHEVTFTYLRGQLVLNL